MDFNNGDPFDGASPIASNSQELENYDDLLGIQVPVEQMDLAIPDFDGEFAKSSYTAPIADMGGPQDQISITTDDPQGATMELCDTLAKPVVTNANSVSRGKQKPCTIKKEVLDEPLTSGIPTNTNDDPVEISDTEDPDSIYKYGTRMSDNTISILESDEDDDVLMLRRDRSPVPIKKEDDEVEFLWAKMDDRVIELDSDNEPSLTSGVNLGKSFLKGLDPKARRPPIDRSAVVRAQEAYLRAHRRNNGIPEPSAKRGAVNSPEHQCPQLPKLPVNNNESARMNDDNILDEDNGKKFRALKKSYNAKFKAETNTVHDDIEFTKAEKAERLRLARLKAEYENARGYSDDDNSDDGLFVSPPLATTSRPKRRAFDDINAEDEIPDSRSVKHRKPNSKSEQAHQGLDQEQEANMMAGLEEYIRKASGGKGKGKGTKDIGSRKDGPKKTMRKPKKAGHLNNLNSLLTSNVYEDADTNLNREALPVSGLKNKQKALAALVACVPLGTTEKDAISEKNRLLKATKTLGRNLKGSCKADGDDHWKLPGLKSSLRHHQVLGAAFLVERETGGEEPLGGILVSLITLDYLKERILNSDHLKADAMGLGKTITTLALLTANPSRDEKHRATLIVCTPALLVQWEREIEKHTDLDAVLKHHATDRVSGRARVRVMQQQDIILTTYQEVVKSYPKLDVPEDIRGEQELKAWWEKQWNQEKDALHQARFYRIVLDESQAIKNHKSQTSIACRALMAKHRWCVSGTPIYNTVEELYPYFRFLRVPYTGSFSDFQDRYCKPGNDDCNSRLHCLLDQIMCRRTLKDTVFGAPLVKLPKHHQRTIDIEFSPVEKAIYRRVFKKFVGVLNKASANGTIEKHPGLGLHAFLRLRQICSHMFLVQEVLAELLDLESIDNMEQEFIRGATLANKNDRNLLSALRRMIEAKPEVVEEPQESEEVPSGELAAKFSSYLKSLKTKSNWHELRNRTQCQSCGDPPESPVVTSCLHVYCEECLEGLANKASAEDRDETACLVCGVAFKGAERCAGLKELEWDDRWLLNEMADLKKRPKKINMEWVFHENKLVMSAKTTAVQTQVEKWLEGEPDKKIIIFSQFHLIMRILEQVCLKKKWRFCTYNGLMSHQSRDKAIKDFEGDGDMKIMIASLKCGGIGLNLSMASKVVSIDPWFNNCVEQQAFCRVYRMGQKSETFITRFIVNNSVDGKLMDMQLKKNALISQAMDDKSVMAKLTVDDILRLFGEVRLDKKTGRPFIHLEDDEKLDSLFEKKGEK